MSKVELKRGDYVSTKGMTEDQYHAVAKAFMEAGADKGNEYGSFGYNNWKFFGWGGHGELEHQDYANTFGGRHLTIEQVLGEEEDETATIGSLLKKADKHARKAQKHEAKRQEAIEQARAMLPGGWELTEAVVQEVDLNDPDNWREGDFVTVEKIDFERYDWWTKGKCYKVFFSERRNCLCVAADDGDHYPADGSRLAKPGRFKFHHRP